MIPRLVESFRNLHLFHSNATKKEGNFLVRSVLKTNEQPGTSKCARSRCKTYPFTLNTSKISGSKRSVKITDSFTCTSANVIYCITCTLCNSVAFHRRFKFSLRTAREHPTSPPFPEYFWTISTIKILFYKTSSALY